MPCGPGCIAHGCAKGQAHEAGHRALVGRRAAGGGGVGLAAVTVPVDWPAGEPRPFALAVPGGVLEMHAHDFCSTRYPGLPPVDAAPHDTDEYRARAVSLGYRADISAMSREHEAAHHLLAWLLGLPYSPTLSGVGPRGGVRPGAPALRPLGRRRPRGAGRRDVRE
jgi:hypothetical protein